MKVLVLTSEPLSPEQLRDAMHADLDPRETEVMVVAPALADSPLKFWYSDADEAIARAREVQRETLDRFGAADMPASGDTGESNPLLAIQDALQTFPADRIVLFTHEGDAQRYREDIDPAEVQERFGVPVQQARIPG